MRDRVTLRAGAGAVLTAALLALAACSGSAPPPIARGTPCVTCGMEIQDLRFACERRVDKAWRRYDAIECLIRDMSPHPGGDAYLADYDQARLAHADSLWVVRGDLPSPMGGGYVAFRARATADSIATATHGRVARLNDFAGPEGTP